MRALLQRVTGAGVSINGAPQKRIGQGLVILLGITHTDATVDTDFLVNKIEGLRIFNDADGKMNLSLQDIGGDVLIASQFTLYGDARRGRRPSFTDAARPDIAIPLYKGFIEAFRSRGLRVTTGEFGADMKVEIQNDGPVTLMLESPSRTEAT